MWESRERRGSRERDIHYLLFDVTSFLSRFIFCFLVWPSHPFQYRYPGYIPWAAHENEREERRQEGGETRGILQFPRLNKFSILPLTSDIRLRRSGPARRHPSHAGPSFVWMNVMTVRARLFITSQTPGAWNILNP